MHVLPCAAPSEIPSESQPVWIQIRPNILSGLIRIIGPDLGPNSLQMLLADDNSGNSRQNYFCGLLWSDLVVDGESFSIPFYKWAMPSFLI